jgi:hypothetical protein
VHSVPFETNWSVGQAELEPVQLSATSHSPDEARQTAPAFPGVWTAPEEESQVSTVQGLPSSTLRATPPVQAPLPSQWSEVVQAFESSQEVVEGAFASSGHAALLPSQTSAGSQTPLPARHSAPALPGT